MEIPDIYFENMVIHPLIIKDIEETRKSLKSPKTQRGFKFRIVLIGTDIIFYRLVNV